MPGIWTAQVQAWMDGLDALTYYCGIFTATPFGTDPLTVEAVGGGYIREDMPHTRMAYNVLANSGLIVFRNLPAGLHIWGLGAWDISAAGTSSDLKGVGQLSTAVDLVSGGTWSVDPNEFQWGIDATLGP